MTEPNYECEVLNGKNKSNVRCQYCNSLMLSKQTGNYLNQDEEIKLPHMHMKNSKDPSTVEIDAVTDFWVVSDMYQFENIGFSNTVGNLKYLTCADCDMGPVGYHAVDTPNIYCVALSRVKHEN